MRSARAVGPWTSASHSAVADCRDQLLPNRRTARASCCSPAGRAFSSAATAKLHPSAGCPESTRAGNPVSLVILRSTDAVMDGWRFCRELRADPRLVHVPVIVFSAVAEDDVPGAVATIRKATVDPTIFLRLIEHSARHRGRLT